MVDNKYFQTLDLVYLIEKIANFSSFELSKEEILNEKISFNPLNILRQNKFVDEALKIIKNHARLNFDGIKNLDLEIKKLNHKQILNKNEIFNIYNHLLNVRRIKNTLIKYEETEELKDFLESLYISKEEEDIISNIFDSNFNFKIDATENYYRLIEKLNSIENNLNEKAYVWIKNNEDSLQEKVVYKRENRVCFLIKNRDKNKFGGLFHGESSSKISSYIEPKEFLELNNQKQNILEEIRQEEERILLFLSELFFDKTYFLKCNIESMVKLDVIFSKAEYGFLNNCIIPNFNYEKRLELIDVAHPLIDEEKVVRNSFFLTNEKHKLIISGSNTGGKTVALKTIGLCVIMSYLAIPLIAKEANIPFYDMLFQAIDDKQSIEMSLSTFSASLVKMNEIILKTTSKSLVLIDEIGNGTDPIEGQALAVSIIDYLVKKDVSLICTTHFGALKDYALSKDNMLLSSVGFDINLLKPTYKYLEGDYGYSNSFLIAEKYLSNLDIIKSAKSFLNSEEKNKHEILEELENLKKETLDKNIEILNLRKKLNEELQKIKEEKKKINDELNIKKQLFFEEYAIEFEELKKNFNKENLNKYKEKLNDLKKEFNEDNIKKDFKINDFVSFINTKQIGKIIAISKNKIKVNVNGMILNTDSAKLEKATYQKPKENKEIRYEKINDKVIKEINVIGLNGDDAILEVSKYIDVLAINNRKLGHIIHGVGKGILQKRIHDYLSKHKNIKEYRFSEIYNGGYGATDIILK